MDSLITYQIVQVILPMVLLVLLESTKLLIVFINIIKIINYIIA